MSISDSQVYRIPKDVLFQEVGGETVLLDLASEGYFGLDDVGTRLWSLLAEGKTVASMVDSLHEDYEVEKSVLENDVRSLLEKLLSAGLIERG